MDESLSVIEETTWLIDPVNSDASQFLSDLHSESEKEGEIRVSVAFAENGEEDGMVVQMDERFRLRLGLDNFTKWRNRSCVMGVRVKVSNQNLLWKENLVVKINEASCLTKSQSIYDDPFV